MARKLVEVVLEIGALVLDAWTWAVDDRKWTGDDE